MLTREQRIGLQNMRSAGGGMSSGPGSKWVQTIWTLDGNLLVLTGKGGEFTGAHYSSNGGTEWAELDSDLADAFLKEYGR